MGVIVGHQTYVECDKCQQKSKPFYSQSEAIDFAKNKWWYINPRDGSCICPDCRNKMKV